MRDKAIEVSHDQLKLTYIINDFFGCDAMYYGVNSFDLAIHLFENGVTLTEKVDNIKVRYYIHFEKYNSLYRGYISYICLAYTNDIYHEVGKIICSSLEKVRRISYTKAIASEKQLQDFWIEEGYSKIDDTLWYKLCPKSEDEDNG